MDNKKKYRFDYFTIENYEKLIYLARNKGFQFILHKDEFNNDRKDIIWRHDVEFSPDIALTMAEIEFQAGVKTTYFFQLHCDYYNTLSSYYTNILKKIKNLGHHIGLHFDSHYYNIHSEPELERFITLDKAYFENVFNFELDTFSFHNTNKFILGCEKNKYGGLINVYSNFFKTKYQYCADSTGIWRFDVLDEVLSNDKVNHLHVLIHDAMWSRDILSPKSRVKQAIQSHANRIIDNYDKSVLYVDDK